MRKMLLILTAALMSAVVLAACGSSRGNDQGDNEGPDISEMKTSKFFDQEDFERSLALRDQEPEGPADEPWRQMLEPEPVDTSEYDTEPPWNLCFSNAAVDNPWRQVGWTIMQAEVELHDEIGDFRALDAEGEDVKQISDIESLVSSGNCDILIVSPSTTEPLTPAVERACEQLPVIVFDRGVSTDCPVTAIEPIGGYAFGATAAEFIDENVDEGGNVLALRVLPGVDILERRWDAALKTFQDSDVNVVGVEFTENDNANVKSIVTDYIQRFGSIDGVWMDAGATSVAATEAFEDAGQEVPPINGEDQMDFLRKWEEDSLTAIAPTYPTYQWRTAIIAATQILSGEEVPKEWILPQPTITKSTLSEYQQPEMPPLHYALCGCEDMPGYPERWK